MSEGGCGKSRIRAFVDVDALAQLLARVHDAFVACVAFAIPFTSPLAMAALAVLVALSSAARVLFVIPRVTLALGVVWEALYGEPGPV